MPVNSRRRNCRLRESATLSFTALVIHTLFVLALASFVLSASACGGGEGAPTSEPSPAAAEEQPTTTPIQETSAVTPSPSAAEIETSAGTFIIKEVELTDRAGQQVAEPGHQILIVALEPKEVPLTSYELFEQEVDAWTDEVFVTGSDGSRLAVSVWTVVLGGAPVTFEFGDKPAIEYVTLVQLIFAPSISPQDLKLFSPGNPPIDLGE